MVDDRAEDSCESSEPVDSFVPSLFYKTQDLKGVEAILHVIKYLGAEKTHLDYFQSIGLGICQLPQNRDPGNAEYHLLSRQLDDVEKYSRAQVSQKHLKSRWIFSKSEFISKHHQYNMSNHGHNGSGSNFSRGPNAAQPDNRRDFDGRDGRPGVAEPGTGHSTPATVPLTSGH